MKRLREVQNKLKAPKTNYNSYGKYNYRSAEDILSAVKPLLDEVGLVMVITDNIFNVEDRFYIEAMVTIFDEDKNIIAQNRAYAREDDGKANMSKAMQTGACSSYARKYALNGMFLIDDVKDVDTDEYHEQTSKRVAKSTIYGKIKVAEVQDVEKLFGKYGVKSYEELTDEQTRDLDGKLTKQIKMVKQDEK